METVKMNKRPMGIIRTLPSLEPDSVGHKRMKRSLGLLEAGADITIYIVLQCIPRVEILRMYLLKSLIQNGNIGVISSIGAGSINSTL